MLKKIISAITLVAAILVSVNIQAYASENTTYTYTISVDGKWCRTQDAYMPGNIYMKDYGLLQPNDIFYKNKRIYIADSGNGRIVVYSLSDNSVYTVGTDVLKEPSGIFVKDNGDIYVADVKAESVFLFSDSGELLHTIKRPDSNLFGSTSVFKPKNVVLSSNGNLFVVGQGTHEGLMQFDENGTFYGFFAANRYKKTLKDRIQDFLFTKEQKSQMLMRTGRAIENIDISERDLIYSVTQSSGYSYGWAKVEEKTENQIKLHNMAGENILSKNDMMNDEWNFVDVAAGPYGISYALTQTGLIYEYDSSGNLIFSFGGRALSSDINGIFTSAAAIDLDENGFLYVLDKERGLIQTFYPTAFAVDMHRAIYCLDTGDYSQGEEVWQSVLRLNSMSRAAHSGYGRTKLYRQQYDEALEHFKIANDKKYYSQTFWEIRNVWIHDNIIYIIAAFVLAAAVIFTLSFIRKKVKKKHAENSSLSNNTLLSDLGLLTKIFRHPVDSFYYIKRKQKGSVLSATVIYVLVLAVYMFDMLCRGFIFRLNDPKQAVIPFIMFLFAAPLALFIIGNTMVSAINEGEGNARNIYIMTAYSFAPYLFIVPPLILLTHILTLNEAFIIQFGWIFAVVWTGVSVFLGLMEIHNYTFKETLKNVLLTFFFMVIAIVALVMMYLIAKQVVVFAEQFFGEVAYRVE